VKKVKKCQVPSGWGGIFLNHTVEHPAPDWVKPSFVIFDIRALWRSALVQCYNKSSSYCQNCSSSVHISKKSRDSGEISRLLTKSHDKIRTNLKFKWQTAVTSRTVFHPQLDSRSPSRAKVLYHDAESYQNHSAKNINILRNSRQLSSY